MAKLSLEDISNVTFHKSSIGGYKPEEVDNFIDDVEETVESLMKSNAKLNKEVKALQLENKAFKEEEHSIKSTLLDAKKLAGSAINEAKMKAEQTEKEANEKASALIADAENQIVEQKEKIKQLKKDVSDFRASLLNMYKEHLQLIDALPKQSEDEQATEKQEAKIEKEVSTDKFILDEYSSLDDIKEMVKQSPSDFINAAVEAYNREDCVSDDDESATKTNEKSNFEILAETKTLNFDTLKFGDDYDLEADKE